MFQFEVAEEKEWYYGCNKCIVCDEPYKHRRAWIKKPDAELPELREHISHIACEKLVNEIKKKKAELEALEEELFTRKYCISIRTFKLAKK